MVTFQSLKPVLSVLLVLMVSCREESKFESGVVEDRLQISEAIPVQSQQEEILPVVVEQDLDIQSETILITQPVSKAPAPPPARLENAFKLSLKVDVVFGVDISGSMNDEILAVQNNLQKMLTTLNSGNIDARVHLILDRDLAFAPGLDPNKIAHVRQRIGSHDAISRLNLLFSGAMATSYRNLDGTIQATPMAFRKNASLELVVISDDNAAGAGNLAADFDPSKTLKATFNAIVGLASSVPSDSCRLAAVGSEYLALAQASKGSILDICSVDWSNLITRLSNDMIKRNLSFTLAKKPADLASIVVTLDKKKLAAADWVYDAKTNSLSLNRSAAAKDGSDLLIQYTPVE